MSEPPGPLDVVGGRIAPIGLAELNVQAGLQTRVDSKYLIDHDQLDRLVDAIGDLLQLLHVDEHGEQVYDTTYFDTPDLRFLADHLQRRRISYKLRSRVYVGSGLHVFEVKLRDGRGHTVKQKVDHADQPADRVGARAERFYRDAVRDFYGVSARTDVTPCLRNRYTRLTLATRGNAERTTLDHGLAFLAPGGGTVGRMDPGRVLVETKSAHGGGLVDHALWAIGVRPRRVSKYCIGLALLHPDQVPHRYARAMSAAFGYQPPAVTPPRSPGVLADSPFEDLPRAPRAPRPPRAARPARSPR